VQKTRDGWAYSASDLTDFLACRRLTRLDRALALGETGPPPERGEERELLARKGDEHETRWLRRLEEEGRQVTEIPDARGWVERLAAAQATREAMAAGAEVIYQGVLLDGRWNGVADFLVRVPGETALGPFGYEPHDTKLGRHARPSYLVQLGLYAEAVGSVQGTSPERVHVILGDDSVETFTVAEFAAYVRRLKERFLPVADREVYPVYPDRVAHCRRCEWLERCDAQRAADDHLSLVAGMRWTQIPRLRSAGVTTLAGLARLAPGTEVPRMHPDTVERLAAQARLQVEGRATGVHRYELLPPRPGAGLTLLPPPSPGDLFFDMEGDPFAEGGGGLEYLFGVAFAEDGATGYRAFWAHTRDEERRALEELVDSIGARRGEDPGLHVYHYAPYEETALKRLAAEHGTREDAVDDLLREGVLVDLYAVVRGTMRHSLDRYGLKAVETFYLDGRDAEVTDAGGSIVAYERYLDDGDQAQLDAIEAYNREDCLSTLALRDWLLELRDEAEREFGVPIPWRASREAPRPEARLEADARVAGLESALMERPDAVSHLLARLLHYHRREARPAWWEWFHRQGLSPEELVDDGEALGDLTPAPDIPDGTAGHSSVLALRFPLQDHNLRRGEVVDPLNETREYIEDIREPTDDQPGIVRIRRGPTRTGDALPRALGPSQPLDVRAQREAIERVARSAVTGDGRYPAVADLLAAAPPRVLGVPQGTPLQHGHVDPAEVATIVASLDRSALVVQGPPGSGKTWTGARIIVSLLRAGRRVGVAATSHKAIHNLLDAVEHCAQERGVVFQGRKKSTGNNPESHYEGRFITSTTEAGAFPPPGDVLLMAGTAYLFARPELDQELDVLVIDEAGQVSLADAVAMGTAARSIVLLGDPMQLAHVSRGIHPEGSGASVLAHMLGDDQTVPPDRGIFLDRSYRMHPAICEFVSEIAYEGRLQPGPGCERQRVDSAGLSGGGLRFLPVEHEGHARSSPEEAARVAQEVRTLLAGGTVSAADGTTRPLEPGDILVVAPYNAQVQCLRAVLPPGVEPGTVDRFQGREAAVVFFTMATSSPELVPRTLDFLFSRNRLNVAVSRARCLAVLAASERLLDVDCRTVEQVRLVNALCRFVELAEPLPVAAALAPAPV
jgi:uncharacterized protein